MPRKLLLLLLCVLAAHICPAQIITTIAGTGIAGYSGDNGPAVDCKIYSPEGILFDSKGNLIFSDVENYVVRKISKIGIITTLAGDGSHADGGDGLPATQAQIQGPNGLALDFKGNLYISEGLTNRIRKIDTNGIIRTIAGNGLLGYSGDGGPATNAMFNSPYGIACDKIGNVFIADNTNNSIRKVDTAGIITTIAGNGIAGFRGDGGPATNAQFRYPVGLVFDRRGNLLIADQQNGRIRKIDTNGIINTIAGNGTSSSSGDGGPATNAGLASVAITVDSTDNIYIHDLQNRWLRKINQAGIISRIAGDGNYGYAGDGENIMMAEFSYVFGMAFDKKGNLYIADEFNNRIRFINFGSLGVAQNEVIIGSIKIFPNPANSQFSISVSSTINEPVLLIIKNLVGATVFTSEGITNTTLEIKANLPSGIYTVQGINATLNTQSKLVINSEFPQ